MEEEAAEVVSTLIPSDPPLPIPPAALGFFLRPPPLELLIPRGMAGSIILAKDAPFRIFHQYLRQDASQFKTLWMVPARLPLHQSPHLVKQSMTFRTMTVILEATVYRHQNDGRFARFSSCSLPS
jgi:hypothetical protein